MLLSVSFWSPPGGLIGSSEAHKTKMCLKQSFTPLHTDTLLVMQFIPSKDLSPFLWSDGFVCLDPVFVPQPFDNGIGRHLLQRDGHAFRHSTCR